MASINEASNVYLNTLKQLQSGGADKTASAGAGPSFGDVLQESVKSAIDAQHKSEQVSAKALVGKADMTEVLQAVTDAEMALQSVLAVRDRVVQAYETVMRTPI
jgi:flagellar hook-basal body complex protein FliE